MALDTGFRAGTDNFAGAAATETITLVAVIGTWRTDDDRALKPSYRRHSDTPEGSGAHSATATVVLGDDPSYLASQPVGCR
ncbi:hypothetical protein [Microbacterium esteraromaticum]|uniref:hypothetical protein n=1 Tax=Microbacterium esteraromaticum TaxID=57043 RepID=UPI0021756101|nr:hypothetical protein [Microbacterium esteraromaticum]